MAKILLISAMICLSSAQSAVLTALTPPLPARNVMPTDPERADPVPPAPEQPLNLPELKQSALAKNLKLAVIETNRLPLVCLKVILPAAGAFLDPEKKAGLAAIVAEMLKEGTAGRDSLSFAQALENLGAELSIDAGNDALVVSVFVLKEKLDPALALISEMLATPAFPQASLARVKEEAKEEIRQKKSDPAAVTKLFLNKQVYNGHPYGNAPDDESVDSISRQDVVEFHKRAVSSPVTIAASGNITMEELKSLTDKHFGFVKDQLPGAPAPAPVPVPVAVPPNGENKMPIGIVDQPGSVQSMIYAGHLATKRNNPDYPALLVLNQILGGDTITGRLGKNIRESKGWAYGAGTAFLPFKSAGMFVAKTSVQVDKTAESVVEILKEIRDIRENDVSPAELDDAKKNITGAFVRNLETVQYISGKISEIDINDLSKDEISAFKERILAVTAGDVRAAAQAYLKPDALQVVIAGDARKIYSGLAQIGAVSVYDADGRPKSISATAKDPA